ncbi:MAG: hypothetical protein HC812_11085 [Leptolyngbya sp. RL_3_1]|nr:hypothetical protein [Leptolyngbya sp. RL_3_1]
MAPPFPPESSYSLATNALDRVLPSVIPVRQVEDAYFDRLYRQFGDSWRITQADSLFDYRSGESTVTFTDRNFPSTFVTLNRVAPARCGPPSTPVAMPGWRRCCWMAASLMWLLPATRALRRQPVRRSLMRSSGR